MHATNAASILKTRLNMQGADIADVCKSAGMRVETLEQVLCGNRKLTAEELLRLCNVLKMDLNDFRPGENGVTAI